MTNMTFRAIWPILDPTRPLRALIAEATADLPDVAVRTQAALTGPGHWSMAPSVNVPGSGNIAEDVLIYEAPAVPKPGSFTRLLLTAAVPA